MTQLSAPARDEPAVPLAHLCRAIGTIDAFRALRADQSHAGLSPAQQEHTLDAYLEAARSAIESATASLSSWCKPGPECALGMTIGDHVFVGMGDIARMSGTTTDAARKWVRELGIERYRFGRRKYVLLDRLLAAVGENGENGDGSSAD